MMWIEHEQDDWRWSPKITNGLTSPSLNSESEMVKSETFSGEGYL